MLPSNIVLSCENVLTTVKRRQARIRVGVNVMALTVDIGNSSQAHEPIFSPIIAEEGGICARWKAARAARNSDVMGETGGVSEGVEGLPLECAVCFCQVNAIQAPCIY